LLREFTRDQVPQRAAGPNLIVVPPSWLAIRCPLEFRDDIHFPTGNFSFAAAGCFKWKRSEIKSIERFVMSEMVHAK
jgi:hypothetical protein